MQLNVLKCKNAISGGPFSAFWTVVLSRVDCGKSDCALRGKHAGFGRHHYGDQRWRSETEESSYRALCATMAASADIDLLEDAGFSSNSSSVVSSS